MAEDQSAARFLVRGRNIEQRDALLDQIGEASAACAATKSLEVFLCRRV